MRIDQTLTLPYVYRQPHGIVSKRTLPYTHLLASQCLSTQYGQHTVHPITRQLGDPVDNPINEITQAHSKQRIVVFVCTVYYVDDPELNTAVAVILIEEPTSVYADLYHVTLVRRTEPMSKD